MGAADMVCTDCHRTREHRVAGLSFAAPASEGRTQCEQCHGARPHGISGPLGPHLDAHVAALACQTCHVPVTAVLVPTLVARDLATAGDPAGPAAGTADHPAWVRGRGSFTWARALTPTYRWFDGTRTAVVLGEAVSREDTVDLNAPRGERRNPAARIRPFKVMTAWLPQDAADGHLLPVDFRGGALARGDWETALRDGAQASGLAYSGRHAFAVTRTWTSLNHQVPPAALALGCADCHGTEAVRCGRCHEALSGASAPAHAESRYPDGPRLDFAALAYEGDPALTGGRFAGGAGGARPLR